MPCAKSMSECRQPCLAGRIAAAKRGPAWSAACKENARRCQEHQAADDSAHAVTGRVPLAKHKLCFARCNCVWWVVRPWAPVQSPPDSPTDVSSGQLTPLSCAVPGCCWQSPNPVEGLYGRPVITFRTTEEEEAAKGNCGEDPAAGRNPPARSFSPPPRTDAGVAALPAQVKRAVVQVISAMAHHGYLEQPGGEAMMEFLVRQCALPSDAVSTSRWGKTPKERYPGGTGQVLACSCAHLWLPAAPI